MQIFLGSICTFGFNFAPYQWALCTGQIVPIQQYTALFSLLGTSFGGNGTSTFGLPNLQASAPIGMGQSTVGSTYFIGQTGGTNSVNLLLSNLPAHTHQVSVQVNGSGRDQFTQSPVGAFPAPAAGSANLYAASPTAGIFLGSKPVVNMANTGGSTPVSIQRPSLAITYAIALQGIFPQRQ